MDDEKERVEALIAAMRRKTDQLGKELEALRKLIERAEDRRIDEILRRRRKPRRNDPQGRERVH